MKQSFLIRGCNCFWQDIMHEIWKDAIGRSHMSAALNGDVPPPFIPRPLVEPFDAPERCSKSKPPCGWQTDNVRLLSCSRSKSVAYFEVKHPRSTSVIRLMEPRKKFGPLASRGTWHLRWPKMAQTLQYQQACRNINLRHDAPSIA